jgi:hypothetical protein
MTAKIHLRRLLGALFALAAVRLDAAGFLVVAHNGGAWSFSEAESILINGKERVRSAALSASQSEVWDSKTIERLPDIALESFSAILRTQDGRLLARSGEAAGRALLAARYEHLRCVQRAQGQDNFTSSTDPMNSSLVEDLHTGRFLA